MPDIIIKRPDMVSSRGSDDLLQYFHASLTPYIIRRVDNCTTILPARPFTAAYPLRYAQVQEALNALRWQSRPFSGKRQRTARTVTLIMAGNLYHGQTCHSRIQIDPREALNNVLFIEDSMLNVLGVNGYHYVFALDELDAWRVDDSWTYIDDGTGQRTLGHILNDVDMALQMPEGFDACLAQRQVYMNPRNHPASQSKLTALLNEYRNELVRVETQSEVHGCRVQVMPTQKAVTGNEGPCAFIDANAKREDCIKLDENYLRVNKIDGLPFVVRRDAINHYQVQNTRNVLSQEEYGGCGSTEITVVEDHIL